MTVPRTQLVLARRRFGSGTCDSRWSRAHSYAHGRGDCRRRSERRRDGCLQAWPSHAVVLHCLLGEQGVAVSVRTGERAVADLGRAQRVAEVATARVEIAGRVVRIHLLVAVLSYSRRLPEHPRSCC